MVSQHQSGAEGAGAEGRSQGHHAWMVTRGEWGIRAAQSLFHPFCTHL